MMGREIRAVALDWEHPRYPGWPGTYSDGSPRYRPLLPASHYQEDIADYELNPSEWDERPDPDDYMPQLAEGTPYGWQMYEDTSEGTPVSPVFATKDEIADWLASPAAGREQVSPAAAAKFAADGWAPTFVFSPATGLVSGVEFGGGPR